VFATRRLAGPLRGRYVERVDLMPVRRNRDRDDIVFVTEGKTSEHHAQDGVRAEADA